MAIIINKNEKNVYEQVEENKENIKLLDKELETTITNVSGVVESISKLNNNITDLTDKINNNYTEFTNVKTDVETNSTNIVNLDNTKQDKLTAGSGITIKNNIISSTGGGGSSETIYYKHILYFIVKSYNDGSESEHELEVFSEVVLPNIKQDLEQSVNEYLINLGELFPSPLTCYDSDGYTYIINLLDFNNLSKTNFKNNIIYVNKGIRTGKNCITEISIESDNAVAVRIER